MNEMMLTTKSRRLSAPGIMADYSKYKAALVTDPSNQPIADSPYQDAIFGSNAFFSTPGVIGQTASFTTNTGWGSLQDFQVDAWVKWDVDSVTQTDNTLSLFSSATAFLFNWNMRGVNLSPTHQPRIMNSGTFAFSGAIQPLRQWHWLSYGRYQDQLYLYVNLVKTVSTIANTPINVANQKFVVGYSAAVTPKNRILFTDVRLSNIARDWSTRSIPTEPPKVDDNTLFMLR